MKEILPDHRVDDLAADDAPGIAQFRYGADVLVQIASIQESLRSASQVLLQGHLRRWVTEAVESHDPLRTEKVFEELTALFGRYGR